MARAVQSTIHMLRNGIRLGRAFGIRVTLDLSWIVVFLLVCWNLTLVFSSWHPQWALFECAVLAVIAAALFFASVLAHELAHSLVARTQGIPVGEIRLFLFGGVSNLQREPTSPEAELATTIVGPITSLVFGGAMLMAATLFVPIVTPDHAFEAIAGTGAIGTLLLWLGAVNIGVGLFNLIPGFPLDGGRILRALLWSATRDFRKATLWSSAIGQFVGWTFVLVGVAMFFGLRVPFFGTGPASGLWLAFIGWFLASAAHASQRNVFVEDAFEGVTVRQLMRRTSYVMPSETTIGDAARQWFMRTSEHAFPVVDEHGQFAGLLATSDVRKVAEDAWDDTPVTEAMTPTNALVVTTPSETAAEALRKLAEADVEQLPVVREATGELVGALERRDVARWLELRIGPPTRHLGRRPA
jgi:Zn-dependent protease/CBS domain-containing protein